MSQDDFKKITKRTYNLIAVEYAKRDKMVEAIEEEFEIKDDLEKFIKLLPKKSWVLDIGCGAGRDSRFFGRHGFKVVGIDFSRTMIIQAKKISRREIYKSIDFEKVQFKNESFCGVWANASLHHMPRKRLLSVLRKIYNWLQGGGFFFIKVRRGDKEGLQEQQKFNRTIKRFFAFYQSKDLKVALKSCGFRMISSRVDNRRGWVSVLVKK